MHIKLFRALKSANVSEDDAAEVVKAIEEFLAVKIKEANATLEAQMKGVEAQQKATNWLIGSIGTVIVVSVLVTGLAPTIIKLVG